MDRMAIIAKAKRLRKRRYYWEEIAAMVGIPRPTIWKWVKYGPPAGRKLTDEDRQRARKMREAGETRRAIAEALGVSMRQVSRIWKDSP